MKLQSLIINQCTIPFLSIKLLEQISHALQQRKLKGSSHIYKEDKLTSVQLHGNTSFKVHHMPADNLKITLLHPHLDFSVVWWTTGLGVTRFWLWILNSWQMERECYPKPLGGQELKIGVHCGSEPWNNEELCVSILHWSCSACWKMVGNFPRLLSQSGSGQCWQLVRGDGDFPW